MHRQRQRPSRRCIPTLGYRGWPLRRELFTSSQHLMQGLMRLASCMRGATCLSTTLGLSGHLQVHSLAKSICADCNAARYGDASSRS